MGQILAAPPFSSVLPGGEFPAIREHPPAHFVGLKKQVQVSGSKLLATRGSPTPSSVLRPFTRLWMSTGIEFTPGCAQPWALKSSAASVSSKLAADAGVRPNALRARVHTTPRSI